MLHRLLRLGKEEVINLAVTLVACPVKERLSLVVPNRSTACVLFFFRFAEFVFLLLEALCVMSQAIATCCSCTKLFFPPFFLISQDLCTGVKLMKLLCNVFSVFGIV